MTASVSGRLAYVGPDQHIHVRNLSDASSRCLSKEIPARSSAAAVFAWPTWSPDGRCVAFVQESGQAEEPGIYLAEADGSGVRRLVSGVAPFYLQWSPDGRWLVFLAQSLQGLALKGIEIADPAGVKTLVEGQPAYVDWSPDSREVLVHIGGSAEFNTGAYLARIDVESGRSRNLQVEPAEHRCASWSPDGRWLLTAAPTAEGDAVIAVDETLDRRVLTPFGGKASFLWAPDGSRVAALVSAGVQGAYDGGLFVVRPDGSDREMVAGEPAIAFFWSPDGRSIGYYTVDPRGDRLGLSAVDVETHERYQLATVFPSQAMAFLLNFFDQYSLASSFWSPDGKHIVFTGMVHTAETNGYNPSGQDGVYVAPGDGSSPPVRVADGGAATFAPDQKG